jgi:hypothetical protein
LTGTGARPDDLKNLHRLKALTWAKSRGSGTKYDQTGKQVVERFDAADGCTDLVLERAPEEVGMGDAANWFDQRGDASSETSPHPADALHA